MTLDLDVWRVALLRPFDPDGNNFKIAHDDWDYEWSQGGHVELGVIAGAFIDEDNSYISASNGYHYTFAMNNVAAGNEGNMIVQETENAPVSIDSVSHVSHANTVTVSGATSAAPSPGEKVYLRYTTDDWATSSFAQAEASGSAWTATLVHASAEVGETVSYYVLTTTVDTPDHDYADLQAIRWNNNNGANYSYEIQGDLPEAPDTQATAIQFPQVGFSSVQVSWTNGDGANRLVVARALEPVDAHPENGQTYAANSQFGSGDELGSDNYVVYAGSGSSVQVTGLDGDTAYHFRVYEFNGGGTSTVYNTSTEAGNPADVTTEEAPAFSLYINEVMASNSETIQDEDGDYPDWVELYNAGADPINLLHWGLSDDYDNPFRWRFGDVTIGPGEFLIVWASNKDRTNAPNLHTSWAISAAGEEVILTYPDGTRIDEMEPIEIPTDISFGRQPDGTGPWLYFEDPTPGAPNTTEGFAPGLPEPEFSVPGGLYASSVTLELSTDVTGAEIRYTTDGSEPTESSPLYSGPLTLESRAGTPNTISEIPTNDIEPWMDPDNDYREYWQPPDGEVFKIHAIRARLFKEDHLPGPDVTHSYLVDAAGVNRYSLPIISIATDDDHLFSGSTGIYVHDNYWNTGRDWERPGTIEFFEADGTVALRQGIGIRIHGGTTRNRPRKSLRIYARPGSFEYPLFPDKAVEEFETFILRSSGNDWGEFVFRDLFMSSLAAHTEVDRMYGRPVIVFINGEYWGIHNMRERFDDGYIEHNYDLDEFDFVQFESTFGLPSDVDGLPHFDRGNPALAGKYMDLHEFIRDQDMTVSSNYEQVQDLMDVDNFIDFYQAHIFFGNTDWPGNNIRVWRSVETNRVEGAPYRHDARLRFMLFDTDFGFGLDFPYVPGSESYDGFNPFGVLAQHNTLAFAASSNQTSFSNVEHHTAMFRGLLENDAFREQFVMRFSDQLNTAYSRGVVTNTLDMLVSIVEPEMSEHVQRWRQPWDWTGELNRVRSYGEERTGAVWGHLQDYFNLGPRHEITLDVSDSEEGHVRVNTMDVDGGMAGVDGWPWTGSYFSDYDVVLTAVPQDGYRFVEWTETNGGASVIASDDASNYGDWTDGSNEGAGFGNWDLDTTASHPSQGGFFLDNNRGGWGMYANSDQLSEAIRPFNTTLAVGQTFAVRMEHGSIESEGSVGVALENSSGDTLWELHSAGGGAYQINGNSTGVGSITGPVDIEVLLTGADTFTARIMPSGNSTTEIDGDLQSAGDQSIARFRAWNYTAGSGGDADYFINHLEIADETNGGTTYSTNESVTVQLNGDEEYVAHFEQIPLTEQRVLIHEWDFEDETDYLLPSFSLGGGALAIELGEETEVVRNDPAQDFETAHLRVNNPLGAEVVFELPTTDYEAIQLAYDTRRSGSGAGLQTIEYTTNGATWTHIATYAVSNAPPQSQSFDFAGISGVNDNADFAVRITFDKGTGGDAGNNRFDDVILTGEALPGVNMPPVAEEPIAFQELIEADTASSFDLDAVFNDPEDDELVFDAVSSDTNAVSVEVNGSTLFVAPLMRGESLVTVTADDGHNPPVAMSFRVLVYPEAYALEAGNFTFGYWDPDTPERIYPEHMLFLQSDESDTAIDTPLLYAYHLEPSEYHADDIAAGTVGYPYNNTGRTRINGLNEEGIAFINTGRDRDLGGALLALDTRDVDHAPVGWLARTILANDREYAIRLQYRVGTTGEFVDVLNESDQPVEYVRQSDGHIQPMDPVELPSAALGEPYVQVLWRYYRTSELFDSGPRAQLRLDDIVVANSLALPAAALEFGDEPTPFFQSGHTLPSFTVHAVDTNGLLDAEFTNNVSLNLSGSGFSISGTTSVTAEDGIATFTNVVVTGIGTNRIQATSGSLQPGLSAELAFSDVTGLLVPQFIQGDQDENNDNNDRIPFAYRAQIDGLLPNATYRYGNRVIAEDDPPFQNGAGNMIFVTGALTNWIRNTDAPDFVNEDFGVRHYEFTTDETGSYTGWFVTEPTGNRRFEPNTTVRMRILLNDGQGGEEEQHYLTLPDEVDILRFGSGAGEATGIMGESEESPRNFLYLYDNTDGTNRPLAGVPIEITGSEVDDRYAQFYEQVVAGTDKFWGTLIPNALSEGVRRIEYRALEDGAILQYQTFAEGIPETINPSKGLDAINLDADIGIPVFLPGMDGRWDLDASWSTGVYPDGTDVSARINEPLEGDRDIDILSPVTIGHLTVNNATSTNRNRIQTQLDGVTLSFGASAGPARLTIDGSGSGFVEIRSDEGGFMVLQSDLLVTITNLNLMHGLEEGDAEEGELDHDYGALRFRNNWTGPGGLIKDGPGVMSMTGSGKDYLGATIISQGVLRVTEPATPQNTEGVSVMSGGQLRLVSDGDRVYPFGGDMTLDSIGRGGDVPAGENLGVLGALRYDPGSGGNRAEVTNAITFAGPTSLHVDGPQNTMDLSGPLSGAGLFSKSGGGTLVLSGDSASYTVPSIVSNGTLQVDGLLGSAVSIDSGGSVAGAGAVGALSGVGVVAPGPGIETLTSPSVNGLNYRFTFGETDASILRLTSGTPFISALNPANTIELFFDVETLDENSVFEGGFFTDEDSDFFASIENASWTFYVRDEEGEVEHQGALYSVYEESLEVGTASATIDFGEGPVSGRMLRIGPDAEPTGFEAWQADYFTEAELADPEVSGPLADPDETGIKNLLRYGLGLGRHDAYEDALPDGVLRPQPIFRHRRLLAEDHGITYQIEWTDDLTANDWLSAEVGTDVIEQDTVPTGDGITEIIEYAVPVNLLNPVRYFRLEVLLDTE